MSTKLLQAPTVNFEFIPALHEGVEMPVNPELARSILSAVNKAPMDTPIIKLSKHQFKGYYLARTSLDTGTTSLDGEWNKIGMVEYVATVALFCKINQQKIRFSIWKKIGPSKILL